MVSSIGSTTLVTLFFLSQLLIISICMHSSNARLLLLLHANHLKPSSTKPLHFSNSLQVLKNNGGGKTVEKARVSAEITRMSTGNAHHGNNMKIGHHGVYINKEGNEMVEDHMDLLMGKHDEKVLERPASSSQHHGKQADAAGLKSDDIVVMDYQPPHRKTPIHNK